MKMDSSLIKLLLSDDTCKARFFTEIDGVLVFDKVGFGWVINNRQFLPDSYTRFKNKIGLTDGNGDFISSTDNVVLRKRCFIWQQVAVKRLLWQGLCFTFTSKVIAIFFSL